MTEHLVLLGDSIFDNASYTRGEPDVIEHVSRLLPEGWRASLLAVDGSTTAELASQLTQVDATATCAIVSVGGNDALANIGILDMPATSTGAALRLFEQRSSAFEKSYRAALLAVTRRLDNVTVCTIYNGNLPAEQAPAARVALMLFNDVILRVAFELGIDVIDLRLICTEPSDYANPIEPSGSGGLKIAHAIVDAVMTPRDVSRVYGGASSLSRTCS